jgi:hypothetical protein
MQPSFIAAFMYPDKRQGGREIFALFRTFTLKAAILA